MNFEFQTNYNSTYWHHIDYASLWNVHVGTHHFRFLEQQFELSEADIKLLGEYKVIRSKWGMEDESKMFEWAFDGFNVDLKYAEVIDILKHFEKKKFKNQDKYLKDYFSEKQKHLEIFKDSLIYDPYLDDSIKLAERLLKIIPVSDIGKSVVCYITFSPDSHDRQGGSNGGDIYFEIIENMPDEIRNKVIATLVHEGIHNTSHFNTFILDRYDKSNRDNWLEIKEGSYTTELGFFNEAYTAAISEAFIRKLDLDKRLAKFLEEKDIYNIRVWKHVIDFYPIMREFLDNKYSPSETFDKLINVFKESAKKY